MIIGHPSIDGNKRISYVLMRLVLLQKQSWHLCNTRWEIWICSLSE
jgi:hypothetical protein